MKTDIERFQMIEDIVRTVWNKGYSQMIGYSKIYDIVNED